MGGYNGKDPDFLAPLFVTRKIYYGLSIFSIQNIELYHALRKDNPGTILKISSVEMKSRTKNFSKCNFNLSLACTNTHTHTNTHNHCKVTNCFLVIKFSLTVHNCSSRFYLSC